MNPPVAVQGHVNVVLGEPRAHLVVIGPGHNVTHALERYAKDYNLQNGVICSCVGDIDEVRLVTQRARGGALKTAKHPRTIVSGSGNVSAVGPCRLNVLMVGRTGKAQGGQLHSCKVRKGSSVEVCLTEVPGLFLQRAPNRKSEDYTGEHHFCGVLHGFPQSIGWQTLEEAAVNFPATGFASAGIPPSAAGPAAAAPASSPSAAGVPSWSLLSTDKIACADSQLTLEGGGGSRVSASLGFAGTSPQAHSALPSLRGKGTPASPPVFNFSNMFAAAGASAGPSPADSPAHVKSTAPLSDASAASAASSEWESLEELDNPPPTNAARKSSSQMPTLRKMDRSVSSPNVSPLDASAVPPLPPGSPLSPQSPGEQGGLTWVNGVGGKIKNSRSMPRMGSSDEEAGEENFGIC